MRNIDASIKKVYIPAVLLISCAVFLGVIAYFAWLNISSSVWVAHQGIIDVRGQSSVGGPYMLTGEWLRVPGLHGPDDLIAQQGEYVRDIRYIRKMRGYTYAFSMVTDQPDKLCFLLPRPHNSRLWVNGTEVLGEDSGSISSVDVFRLLDYVHSSSPQQFDFVLQVSSSSIYDVYQGLLVGQRNLLTSTHSRWLMLDLIAVGLYLMLCILMLALFLQKRSETYLPLLALSALTELAHFLLITRHPMMAFFHLGTTTFYRQFNFVNYFICKLLLSEEGDIPRWMDYAVYIAVPTTALGCLVLPEWSGLILRITYLLYLVLQCFILIQGSRKGSPGAFILFVGWAIAAGNELFYTFLNAGWFPQGVVDVQIMPAQYARLAFVLAFAIATCQKFAQKFCQADALAANLEQQVSDQTQALRRANRQLLVVQEKRQRFMTDMVHNLRNPLFVVEGYVDLLNEELPALSPSGQHYLSLTSEKLDYMEQMVDDLFFISRLEDGQIKFRFTQFDLEPFLQAAVRDADISAGEKALTIALECPRLLMVGDQFHLRQAVDNVLDNAIRHSKPEGKILVHANVAGALTLLKISDHGDGIPPEHMEKLFERYTSKGAGGSTGLGLSICKQIVARHGGSIQVESAVGTGTTFIFRLPQNPADVGSDD